MKKITLFITAMLLITIFGCSTENSSNEESSKNAIVEVFEKTIKSGQQVPIGNRQLEGGEICGEPIRLLAGQHHEAGFVTISTDGENLIITYTTNEDWIIDLTHLSIGNCEDQSIPTTGSGNPKVGHFEHTEPHSSGTNEVIYVINLESLNLEDRFCFAAHAEVQGPTGGETAWAEGQEFDGNSWAMFVESFLSTCVASEEEEEEVVEEE